MIPAYFRVGRQYFSGTIVLGEDLTNARRLPAAKRKILLLFKSRKMDHSTIPVKFEFMGISYEGWANPSRKQNDYGMPESYQVVLNKEPFGNLSLDRGKWVTDERRPQELVVRVGKFLDQYVRLFVAA